MIFIATCHVALEQLVHKFTAEWAASICFIVPNAIGQNYYYYFWMNVFFRVHNAFIHNMAGFGLTYQIPNTRRTI